VQECCDWLFKKFEVDVAIAVLIDQKRIAVRRSSNNTTVDVSKFVQRIASGGGHEAAATHQDAKTESHAETAHHSEAIKATVDSTEAKHEVVTATHDTLTKAHTSEALTKAVASPEKEVKHDSHKSDAHTDDHAEHVLHVLHQLQNKPWAALYVACIFFMLIAMGALAFYAIQQVAQAGWSPVLFRVMQGITAYLPIGSIFLFVFLILCGLHFNHLFIWLDPEVVAADKIIANKSGYLNFPFWIIRAAIFLLGWNVYRYFSRKNCLAQDEASDNSFYKKNFNISAMFLVFFIVTESIMSWDWIMSLDPHWASTLFGWYVFASFFVSGITTICLVTLYLKSIGNSLFDI
jgi:cation transport ATPase